MLQTVKISDVELIELPVQGSSLQDIAEAINKFLGKGDLDKFWPGLPPALG